MTERSIKNIMPRSPEQFEIIRQERKRLIMDTALDLFAQEGYHSCSINKIASAAGISKGLLYNYFDSKEALLIAIISEGFEELIEQFDPNHDGVLSEDEMLNFLDQLFKILEENNQHWRLYYAVFFQPDVYELIKEQFRELFQQMIKLLTDYFTHHGVEEPENEALVFGTLLDGIAFNYVMYPELYPIETLKKYIIKKFAYLNK